MHEIVIDDFEGRHVVLSPDELESIVSRRFLHEASSFWLSPAEAEYPCLAVMVTGELAVVHWFPVEGSAGHQSHSDDVAPGDVRFVENEQGAEMSLPRSAAVGIEVALRCVRQFADDSERPSATSWIEL